MGGVNIYTVSLDWEHQKLSSAQLEELNQTALSEPQAYKQDDGTHHVYGIFVVDDAGLAQLACKGLRVNIQRTRAVNAPAAPAIAQRESGAFNAKVQVHVAGLGLLNVTEVENHNDCCTDYLQTKLADGWRILAVCVQPDQRRPDYILGRSKGVVTP